MLIAPTQHIHTISCEGRIFGTHIPQFQKSVVFAFPERKAAAALCNHIRRFGLTDKINFVPASRFHMLYNPGTSRRALDRQLIQLNVVDQMDLVMKNNAYNIDTFIVDEFIQTPRGALILDGAFVDTMDRINQEDTIHVLKDLYDMS